MLTPSAPCPCCVPRLAGSATTATTQTDPQHAGAARRARRMADGPPSTPCLCGYDFSTIFLATGYCLTSRRAGCRPCRCPARRLPRPCLTRLRAGPCSLLSIINKYAVLHFPYPSALTGLQYLTSAGAVFVL